LTDISTTGNEGAELSGETVADKDLLEDLCDGDGGEVGGWGTLPDDGVSAHQGDGRVPACGKKDEEERGRWEQWDLLVRALTGKIEK
jgi:hypothetical protein